MTPRALAVQGIGFGALAIATMGLLGGTVAQPEIGLARFVDVAAESREVEANGTCRTLAVAQQEREVMAQEVQRTIEVLPVESTIEVVDTTARTVSVDVESREIEVQGV